SIEFPVVMTSKIESSEVSEGDKVEANLKENLVINNRLIAPAGSLIVGHIKALQHSRRLLKSIVSPDHRFHKGTFMQISFDEIVTPDNKHLEIVGHFSEQSKMLNESYRPRKVEIGKNGELKRAELVFSSNTRIASTAINFVASSGLGQMGSVASFGALPLVMGVVGAIEPDMVSSKPKTGAESHPRIKGFATGIASNLPGATVVSAMVVKGSELRLEKGDQLMVQAHSPYPEQKEALAAAGKAKEQAALSVKAEICQPKSEKSTKSKIQAESSDILANTKAAQSPNVDLAASAKSDAVSTSNPVEVSPAKNTENQGHAELLGATDPAAIH
ncbi:MAG: hypothetical protein K2X81_25185, partial [Candidatus Obscuribacterales bacterium]|nr:hypothetical protein [Candidatus Obscuribacterales bacterium]